MLITISQEVFLLITLLIQSGLSFLEARERVSQMSDEEVTVAIVIEKKRNKILMAELGMH